MATQIKWLDKPADKDFAAAAHYLGLLMPDKVANAVAEAFSKGSVVMHRVNDILRASGLPLLAGDDPQVRKDLKKMQGGDSISPVLLVRGHFDTGHALTIADGYHRVCASYHVDEDLMVPCVIVDDNT